MSDPRQRPIPVTSAEREVLNKLKEQYEKVTGHKCDWGDYLCNIALFSLVTVGTYRPAENVRLNHYKCPECLATIAVIPVKPNYKGISLICCPECNKDIVIIFE